MSDIGKLKNHIAELQNEAGNCITMLGPKDGDIKDANAELVDQLNEAIQAIKLTMQHLDDQLEEIKPVTAGNGKKKEESANDLRDKQDQLTLESKMRHLIDKIKAQVTDYQNIVDKIKNELSLE